MEVIAKINISTSVGRKILSEMEKHKKLVKITYPLPDFIDVDKTYTQQEFEDKVKEKFNETYGVNFDMVKI
jgi:hypothetical protein